MRFFGEVGYGVNEEIAPGVWDDTITEVAYYGDVVRNLRNSRANEDSVNNDLSVSNSISILADGYAYENFFAIRYIRWSGVLWTVTNVELQRPRLILSLGERYNGPTAKAPVNS